MKDVIQPVTQKAGGGQTREVFLITPDVMRDLEEGLASMALGNGIVFFQVPPEKPGLADEFREWMNDPARGQALAGSH